MDLKQVDMGDDLADCDTVAEAVNPQSRDHMPNNIEYVRSFSQVVHRESSRICIARLANLWQNQ